MRKTKREDKLTLGTIGILLTISCSIVIFWGYSIEWAQWDETIEIWLPEQYSITNKVDGGYLKVMKFEPSGSINELALEEYKRHFDKGSVTITTDRRIYYSTETLTEHGKVTYVAFQKLTSVKDPDVSIVGTKMLTDREIKLRCFDATPIFFAFLGAAICSIFGGLALAIGAERILLKRDRHCH